MPDVIDATGLTVMTAAEITAQLNSGLQGIYGADINLDQNSPDGQMVGILTQMAVDIREMIVSVNNGFDPDQAQGVILDQRVTINDIQREGGTYTIQPIDLVIGSTVTLVGLDGSFDNPNGTGYTVQDGSGNQFILITTETFTAGSYTRNFRAKNIGLVNVPVDTITIPVTIVLGVSSVNNNSAAITVGETQETDAQLRTRREQSTALSTTGYLNGLLGAIKAISGVTEAELYENKTGVTDANGIPPHCIWLIVAGGSSSDIGNEMYNRKSYGCDMKGDVTYDIVTASDALFTAQWDTPNAIDLYIRFTIQRTVPGFTFDEDSIKTYIATNLSFTIGQAANTAGVVVAALAALAAQGGGGVPVLAEISDDGISYTDYLTTPTLKDEWTLDTSRISITVV
jgi:hypothetical protein